MWVAAQWVGVAGPGSAGLSTPHCQSQVMVTSPVAASEAPALGSLSFLTGYRVPEGLKLDFRSQGSHTHPGLSGGVRLQQAAHFCGS